MSKIEVEIINSNRAKVYNKDYKGIVSGAEISIDRAKQLLKENKASLVLRDKQKIGLEELKDYTSYCKVILRSNTEACIEAYIDVSITSMLGITKALTGGKIVILNVGKADIEIESGMAGVIEDDVRYLNNAMYSIDGSSGEAVIASKRSTTDYSDLAEEKTISKALTVQRLIKMSNESLVTRLIEGRHGKYVLSYVSKDSIKE